MKSNSNKLLIVVVCVMAVIGTVTLPSNAQHSDITISLVGNQLQTNQDVYPANFPTFGIASQYTSNPGFSSETDVGGGIGANDQLAYNVLDGLWFWDGQHMADLPDEVQIRVQNIPSSVPDTIVSNQTGRQDATFSPVTNRIGAASMSGEVHSHVNYFLEPNDGNLVPPAGVYGLLLQLVTERPEVQPSNPFVIAFNFGALPEDYDAAVAAFQQRLNSPTLPGDFDQDGQLTVVDLDLLTQAVGAGNGSADFDLNEDNEVNLTDRQFWVEQLKRTYFGDANLDGEFSSADLVTVFQQGEYEDAVIGNSTWADGDWNGDGEFSSADFVMAFQGNGYEQGPRPNPQSVPEPNGLWPFALVLLCFRNWRQGHAMVRENDFATHQKTFRS